MSSQQQQAPSNAGGSRKISFNVSDQYDIQDVIGEGAYGVVWYVVLNRIARSLPTDTTQLSAAQAIGSESGYQEDHSLRSFHVLSENFARDEVAALFQPREHHFHTRYSKAAQLRDLQRSLPHSGS